MDHHTEVAGVSLPFITVSIPSAVALVDVHMSKKRVTTQLEFSSNIHTVSGFIFSKSVSLEPSIERENV